MQPSLLRSRPLWKSARPEDPAGHQPFHKPTLHSRGGRLHFEVQTSTKLILVDVLTLHDDDHDDDDSNDKIKQKVKDYATEKRDPGTIELVTLIMSKQVSRIQCLSQVQLLLLDFHPIPVLLADSPADVERALRSQLANSVDTSLTRTPPIALLAHASASAPSRLLSQQEAATLHSLFPTIRDLEAGARTSEGQALIKDLFNAAVAKDIVDFWEDEYLAA